MMIVHKYASAGGAGPSNFKNSRGGGQMCTNAVLAVVRIGCLFTQADRKPKRNTII
ncbi:hypothetical protein J2X72_004389 [Phyllobacterium sp. 1468]|nr:hypothetical protein [Phyllobacterium sp. 1468]